MSIYVNIFLSPFMYCYFYYVHLFLENGSFFWYYIFKDGFGITWTIIYSRKLHSLKTSVELFCIFCWNSSLLRSVKPCLKKIYKDVFCINLMLTPLFFFFFSQVLLSCRPFWGTFWSVLWYFYSISWEILGLYSW